MNFAVIDIETTGGQYNEEGITEVAIHKFDGIEVIDSFISLINPEKEIQPFVANLTGINNKMLRNAPKFYEVAKRVLEITEDCVLVAHNASFDYRVLRNEFSRLGFPFEIPTLCTVELSQKLLPDQETYSLGKLCRKIGIPVSDRHRANGDALAALQLFEILLQKDTDKTILKSMIKVGNKRDLSGKLLNILDTLPPKEGLYFFHRYNGDIIHIGKGKNIQKAVNRIFLRTSRKSRAMIKEMDSVSFELTGNELISQIKIEEALESHRPKFNKLSKKKPHPVNFSHENMILIDKGRDANEKSVILIESNSYRGHGFASLKHQFNNLDVLRTLINRVEQMTYQNVIIKKYLSEQTVEKIIRF